MDEIFDKRSKHTMFYNWLYWNCDCDKDETLSQVLKMMWPSITKKYEEGKKC